jgi:hypothetical protein
MHEPKHFRVAAHDENRRQFLRRAAVVGTTVWAVPTIVTIDAAASQQITSPPPTPPPRDVGEVTVSSPAQPAGMQDGGLTELPRTGVELDDLAVAGLAACAGGAALLLWSAELEP